MSDTSHAEEQSQESTNTPLQYKTPEIADYGSLQDITLAASGAGCAACQTCETCTV
jgi:hypothetical protein